MILKTEVWIYGYHGRAVRRSSDAYFKKNDRLIIVEMKGFMSLIDVLIKNEKQEANYRKLFVKPVIQALERFLEIKEEQSEFARINKLIII